MDQGRVAEEGPPEQIFNHSENARTQQLKKLEGYEFNMEGASDSAGEIGLDTGQYDMLAQGLILSPEREESYLVPDESNGPSLMKIFATGDQEGEIESLDDLQGKNQIEFDNIGRRHSDIRPPAGSAHTAATVPVLLRTAGAAIDKGQHEAAESLGYTLWNEGRRVR